nr:PREDICTED: uncharacterized protein LOC109042013 [Bemisia tabaci]
MSHQDNDAQLDTHLLTDIWSTLQELETPSAFAFSAVRPSLPNPGLFIPPYGLVGLPLSKDDAQKIISQARQSPFGKGEETVIDTSVRKSWELNTNQFSLNNPDWKETEQEILESVILGLGLPKGMGRVSAELYKLLLYEPGAFFKPHKDSEKAPGMFATLVISLPSPHEGGKLVMTFNGEKYEFETADFSAYRFSFAAWYSDILHEVLPVKSGYRLVLTYNLIRQTNFEIPSYDLVRGRAQQLSMLLKQYDLRVLQNDDELPAILIHKLKHEYTPASLNLRSLKPPDLAQVSTLAQLATELDFCIFLATLELKVNADEEYDDDDYKEKETRLKNIVDLDGKLILEEFDCLEDALIDETPQDEDREADESVHEGYTGNEGCPVTYWYRDTVVFLVPPSTKFSFLFRFRSDGSVIEPLFNSLMKKYSNGPAQKSKLKKLCKRALKQNIGQGPIPDFFQQAAATALDLGWFDLFEKASEKTRGKIVLDHAHMLGRLTAKNGVAAISDQLMKGTQAASSIPKMVQFLKVVAEGFEKVLPESGSAERATLKQWSDKAIFSAAAELTTPTKSDAASLAQLCKTIDWSLFETEVMPIISEAAVMFTIWFINELISILGEGLSNEQQLFIEIIVCNIWDSFVFSCKQGGSAFQKKGKFKRK